MTSKMISKRDLIKASKPPIQHYKKQCQHLYRRREKEQQLHQDHLKRILKFAIESNNAGVRFLEIGKRNEAWELFQGTMEVMFQRSTGNKQIRNNKFIQRAKELIIEARQQWTTNKENNKNKNNLPTTSSSKTHFPVTVQSNFSKSSGFVYQYGMMIRQSMISGPFVRTEQALCSLISSVMLYNLGLVHHLAYLEGSANSALLDVALNLYNKADRLLGSSNQTNITHQSHLSHLRMIIVNNKAIIHHDLYCYNDSRMHLERLSKFISQAIIRSASEDASNNTTEHRVSKKIQDGFLEQFVMNALHLKEPLVAGAA